MLYDERVRRIRYRLQKKFPSVLETRALIFVDHSRDVVSVDAHDVYRYT